MVYMVIETFRNPDGKAVYQRFQEKGRMLPAGLHYVQSWVEPGRGRCFQVMQTEDPRLLKEWARHWEDLVDFEIVPVVSSQEAARSAQGPDDTLHS
jgi:hypothetical protein